MGRLVACLLLFVTMGCMMQSSAKSVNWDLSESHATTAVGWPSGDDGVYEIEQADASIRLPGGHTFDGRGVRLRLFSDGDQVQILAIMYPKTSLDDAYQQARDLARQWHLRTDDLEAWHREVVDGRARGVKDASESFYPVLAGSSLAPGGPTPYAKLLDSFDDQKPVVLDFEFQWV